MDIFNRWYRITVDRKIDRDGTRQYEVFIDPRDGQPWARTFPDYDTAGRYALAVSDLLAKHGPNPTETEPAIPGLESVRETENPDPGPVAPVPPSDFTLTAPPETDATNLTLF